MIRDAELDGRSVAVRCEDGLIREIADRLDAKSGEDEIDARGGALLPGLHDHHLHLHSLAAHFASVPCGPPSIESPEALAEALRCAESISGWIRGTGYFESVAGKLDRNRLDALGPDRPLRIQHRSGSMWFLNSRAIVELGLDRTQDREATEPPGVERDETGRATGRLFRADEWLRERFTSSPAPDLGAVGAHLAHCGVTSVTDATASNGPEELALFRAAQRSGALPQRLRMMGDLSLAEAATSDSGEARDWLEVAEYKIMLDEPALPDFDELVSSIAAAHQSRRCVAFHSVTRTEIHFALAALEAAGVAPGDRLEHASVTPPEAFDLARRLGLTIVTQPNFIAERGDAYHENVESRDLTYLYRVRSWLEAGVSLAAGTDAPFGDPDPWLAMRAAVLRETRTGRCMGEEERVSPESALALFGNGFTHKIASNLDARGVAVGQRADLCLLKEPWSKARRTLSSELVAATICDGRLLWNAIA